jgi:hypothetical protein
MEAAAAHGQWYGQKRERKLSEVANGKRESLSYLSSAFKLKVARQRLFYFALTIDLHAVTSSVFLPKNYFGLKI